MNTARDWAVYLFLFSLFLDLQNEIDLSCSLHSLIDANFRFCYSPPCVDVTRWPFICEEHLDFLSLVLREIWHMQSHAIPDFVFANV